MNKLFQCSRMPTAVIAINDYAAAGVARSIIEHGCRVPDDISVISYDNTQVAELLTPRMTSIDYRYEEFAGKLVGTALAAIAGKSIPRIQLQTPDLVVRESTGAAKNSEV